MQECSNSIQDLPTDILIDILCRLPLKARVQLSCVCKFWKDFICSNRIFIRCSSKVLMYSVRNIKRTPDLALERFMKADEICLRKSFFLGPDFYLVGCINGVFCFNHYWSHDIYLWNPALQQFRVLPSSSHNPDVVAFFSEPTNDDYIVVKIFLAYSEVHIYKLSSNSWNKTDFLYDPSGKCVYIKDMVALVHNGALHWLSNPYRGDVLFLNVYDLSSQRFQETLLSNLVPINPLFPNLGLIKGCISLFGRSTTGYKYEVWMMKEYGLENSWTKQFEVTSYIVPQICRSYTIAKFLVKRKDYVVLCDPEKEETEFAQDASVSNNYVFTDNYVESAVSVFPRETSVSCSSFLKKLFVCLFG